MPDCVMRTAPEDDEVEILPIELDAAARARFARFLRLIEREGEAARVASELFTSLIFDDEFANINALSGRSGLHS